MEEKTFSDENTPTYPSEHTKLQTETTVVRRTLTKSPLKPVNDEKRLNMTKTAEVENSPSKKTPVSSPYNYIRQLDSAERWIERTSVVTKQDHLLNLKHARSILENVVDTLPVYDRENNWLSEALSDASESEDHLYETENPVYRNCSDIDELADLLGGLDIATKMDELDKFTNMVKPCNVKTLSQSDGEDDNEECLVVQRVETPGDAGAEKGEDENLQLRVSKTQVSETNDCRKQTDSDDKKLDQIMSEPDSKTDSADPNVVLGAPGVQDMTSSGYRNQTTEENTELVNTVTQGPSVLKAHASCGLSEQPHNMPDSSQEMKDQTSDSNIQAEKAAKHTFEMTCVPRYTDPCSNRGQPDQNRADKILNSETEDNSVVLPAESSSLAPLKQNQVDSNIETVDLNQQLHNSPAQKMVEGGENQREHENFKSTSILSNFPSLEIDDPFKPKSQLVNSPTQNVINADEYSGSEGNPFETKSQLVNSPAHKSMQTVPSFEAEDPFKPVSQLPNSPVQKIAVHNENVGYEDDPFKARSQLVNSPALEKPENTKQSEVKVTQIVPSFETEDPFKPVSQLPNSPVQKIAVHNENLRCEDDPFKAQSQLDNSPTLEKSENTVQTELKVMQIVSSQDEDPFKPVSQLPNSPVQKMAAHNEDLGCEDDPFKVRSQLVNSPALEKPETTVQLEVKVTQPVSSQDEDPFKPSSQLPNSPAQKIAVHNEDLGCEDDPFKVRSQLVKSPALEKPENTVQLEVRVTQPVSSQDEDPFKPVSQLPNSPVQKMAVDNQNLGCEDDPFTAQSQLDNLPVHGKPENSKQSEAKDPFKATAQLCNSPIQKTDPNPRITGSPHKLQSPLSDSTAQTLEARLQNEDQSNMQLLNAPNEKVQKQSTYNTSCSADCDPFKPKSQLQNSPAASSKPTEQITEEMNPFAPTQQLANTPPASSDTDNLSCREINDNDFSATAYHSTTPDKYETKSCRNQRAETVDPNVVNIHSQDLITPNNSTEKGEHKSQNEDSSLVESEKKFKENRKVGADSATSESPVHVEADSATRGLSIQVEADSMTSGSSFQPPGQSLESSSHLENVEMAEEESFIPATQAFNDPAFFDQLEKVNSTQTNFKRGSVLMNFDPLQERRESGFAKPASPGPVQKPSRVSDAFKDSRNFSMVDESVCLLGTPPRVARRRTLTRRVHNNRVQSIEEETASNEIDMIMGLEEEDIGMDTILQENLLPSLASGTKLVDIGEQPTYTESEMRQIRAQLTMHFQEVVLIKDKEFQERVKKQEQEMELEKTQLKAESDGFKNKLKSLQGKLKSLNEVMSEYRDIISQVTEEKEKTQKEKEKKTLELTEQQTLNKQMLEDNKTLEKSFDDLFHRYEKLKSTLEKTAENEKILRQALESAQEKCKASKETAKKIKEMAEAKLAEQEEKYEKLSASSKDETLRLEAALKRRDLQIQGLETSLEQKKKENKELTDLCDSLINKVAPS